MAMQPKKTKHRKLQKGSMSGLARTGCFVHFGEYGMQAIERGWVTARQLEACRIAINRFFNRRGKVWIRVFPDKPITKKPAETRMGKGKGGVEEWVSVVLPGRVMFEVGNVPKHLAQDALRRAAGKLGIKTRFVERLPMV